MEYEINFLILQSNTAELTKLRQEMEDLIKSCGCEVLEKKEYLKRKLAYEINREGYGFHTVLRFKFPEGKNDIKDLKDKLNLNFKVARYLIIRPDGLSSLKDLEKKVVIEKKEKPLEKKTVLKPEEVEKILAGKKVKEVKLKTEPKAELKVESTIKPEVKKDEIKKEDLGKIKKVEDKSNQKEEEGKEDKKENKKEKSKDGDKDKVSLDDLDEKLDEILNI